MLFLSRPDALAGTNLNGTTFYDSEGNPLPDENIAWTLFTYDGSKWASEPMGPDPASFEVHISGCVETVTASISYSLNGGSDWTTPSGDSYFEDMHGDTKVMGFHLDNLEELDPSDINFVIKATISDTASIPRQMMDCGLGANDSPDNPYIIQLDPGTCINADGTIFEYHYADVFEPDKPHDIHIPLGYPNGGNAEAVNAINKFLYAYTEDGTPLEDRLTEELYDRFFKGVDVISSFGIDVKNHDAAVTAIKERMSTPTLTRIIPSKDSSNADVKEYSVSIEWGIDERSSEPVVSTIYAYSYADTSAFLVCTDFNDNNCKGNDFYIKKISDRTDFIDGSAPEHPDSYMISANYSNVAAGMNGARTRVLNEDGMYSFELYNESINYIIRIMPSSNTYVAITPNTSGCESGNTDGMKVNGNRTDIIWETDANARALEYIGNTKLNLSSLNSGIGITTYEITNVTLKNASQSDGVVITPSGTGEYTIEFLSNYYDEIPLTIEYAGGITKEITIERVGLVICYKFLMDNNPDGLSTDNIHIDCKSTNIPVQYDYNHGQKIIVYATYYHPSAYVTHSGSDDLYLSVTYGDGSTAILNHSIPGGANGHIGASGGAVETTTFFIGFENIPPDSSITNMHYSKGNLSATVINGGFDDPDSFGGTQCGSGKGAYWDGNITFELY